jgi:hypothetical protein
MLNQIPRKFKHVNRILCEDVSIFLEEFDERKFLLGSRLLRT